MKDQDKTKEQLIGELTELRRRVVELEVVETERKRAGESLDYEPNHRAFNLNILLLATFIVMLLGTIAMLAQTGKRPLSYMLPNTMFLVFAALILAACYYLSRKDRVRAGSIIFTVMMVIACGGAIIVGGTRGALPVILIIPVVSASITLGTNASLALAALSATALMIMGILERNGIIKGAYPGPEVMVLLNIFDVGFSLFFTTLGIWLAGHSLRQSLERARKEITERKRVEEALRFTQFAIDQTSDAAFWIGPDAQFIYINDAACRNLGYSREELLAMTVHDIDPNFPVGVWSDHWREVKEYGALTIESRNRARDGRVFPVEITVNFVEFAGQEYNCAFARDISERKRAEETLRRHNRNLALLNRVSRELVATLDQQQVAEQLLQEVTDAIGAEGASVWLWDEEDEEQESWLICQATSHRDLSHSMLNLRLSPGQGIAGWVAQTGESTIVADVANDSRFFPGIDKQTDLRTASLLVVPLRVRDVVIGVLEVVNKLSGDFGTDDLTLVETLAASAAIAVENARLHRRLLDHAGQLEQLVEERTTELQTQCARLDAVLHSTADGIVVADAEGEILQANPVAQAWLTQTLSPEEGGRLRETVRSIATQVQEHPVVTLELTGLDLELSGAPILEPEADAILGHRLAGPMLEESAAVVAVHDVSHLRTLDRMKSHFVANVSHELRTPIATVKAYAHLIQQTPPEDIKWEQYVDALVEEVDRQAQLGEDIVRATRVYTGELELSLCPTSLNQLSGVIIDGCQVLAQKREVTLEHRPADSETAALVDSQQIAQVLNILVEDAIRYSSAGGQVTISAGTEDVNGDTWATIAVSDTGGEIPAADLLHVFERFFREEEPQSVRVSKTGLRLMIVKGIVELHGGRVTVESEVGVGSTFTIWLPLAD